MRFFNLKRSTFLLILLLVVATACNQSSDPTPTIEPLAPVTPVSNGDGASSLNNDGGGETNSAETSDLPDLTDDPFEAYPDPDIPDMTDSENAALVAVPEPATEEAAMDGEGATDEAETPAEDASSGEEASGAEEAQSEDSADSEAAMEDESAPAEGEGDQSPRPTDAEAAERQTHTIAVGDSLSSLAVQYDWPMAAIAAVNDLATPDDIKIEDALIIPTDADFEQIEASGKLAEYEVLLFGGAAAPAEAAADGEESGDSAETAPASTARPTEYTVQAGDSLFDIALSFGLTLEQMQAANGIDNADSIFAGQLLRVPGVNEVVTPVEPEPVRPTSHEIQAGETLQSIAAQYGLTYPQLADANGITNVDDVQAGQVLTIPAP